MNVLRVAVFSLGSRLRAKRRKTSRTEHRFLKSLFYPSRVSVPQVAAYECEAHPPRVALQEALFQRANMK